MKKILIISFFAIILFSACAKQPNMNELADDGKYYYRNSDLGFNITFPEEFKYYQTQRKNYSEYIVMEYFVPTSDVDYPMDVPSYARPVEVRIFLSENWDEILEDEINGTDYQVLGEKDGQTYTIKFWDQVPVDWAERWNNKLKQGIIDSFIIQ